MMKLVKAHKKSQSDGLVSRETVVRDFRVELSKMVNAIEEEYSMTEDQAVALLIDLFKKAKPGEFMPKHADKPSRESKTKD